jgi:flagellar basal body-associated protein FliL
MKKSRIILIVILVIAASGVGVYNYVFHGGARDLASEETKYTVSSKQITDEFTANADVANKKYLEKAVAIKGTITEVNATSVIVDNTIICNLKSKNAAIKKNQTVTIKGRVVGYDDLMGELKLDQCLAI